MIIISHRSCFSKSGLPTSTNLKLIRQLGERIGSCCVKCISCNRTATISSIKSTSSLARTNLDSNSWLFGAHHHSIRSSTTTTTNNNNINNNNYINRSFILTKTTNYTKSKFHSGAISNSINTDTQQSKESKSFKMECKIISGKEVSDEIRASLKAKVEGMKVKPRLAIVQVGGREDSNVYIRMKVQFAESIGGSTELIKLGRETTEDELAKRVQQLNQDSSIHGIITQLPFDSTNKIDSDRIVNLIDPKKDVDGLSVYSAGMLLHGKLDGSSFIPCTPKGCMELIKKSGIKLEGSRSVVFGRSKIVGSPMAQLLLWSNSTVTICHSKTKNAEQICREADIVVVAVGRAQMVKKDWIKPGAVVIDCGINVIPDATKKSGTRLVGDADFEDCKTIAGAITPVPGGVGPMTVAMLISNTVEAAARACSEN